MAEYIDKQALFKHVESEYLTWADEYDVEQVLADIEDAPATDVVEVVRCKDCKCWHTDYCPMNDIRPNSEFYCAWGDLVTNAIAPIGRTIVRDCERKEE